MQLCQRLLFLQTSISTKRIPSINFVKPRAPVAHDSIFVIRHPDPIAKPFSQSANTAKPSNSTSFPRGPPTNSQFIAAPSLSDWQINAINEGGIIDLSYLKVKPIQLKKWYG